MTPFRKLILAAALALLGAPALAASIPLFGPSPLNYGGANPTLIPDMNNLLVTANQNVNPATQAEPTNFRNWLDNGAMDIAQRGSSQINCGGTTGTGSAATLGAGYVADRWACIVNVGSQAGKVQVSTTTPPPGYNQYSQIIRNSGALAQPVCLFQEIQTLDSTKLQGQTVVISATEQALANLSADNGSQTQFVIITGTGTDQGMGTLTASPAITPAFTGVATPLNQTITIGTSFQRYVSSPALIPVAATEIAAGVCFTPTTTASISGATDGFNVTGIQLEIAPPGCISATTPVTTTTAVGTCASPFEFRPMQVEQLKANRYYYVYTEATAPSQPPFAFGCNTTNTPTFGVPFPTPMRAAPSVPTSGNSQVLTVGGIKVTPNAGSAAALTGINNPASSNTTTFGTIAGTNTCATTTPTGNVVTSSTTGILPFSADF